MIVLDETKKVFDIIRDPRNAKYDVMTLIESLLFAYKATIIANLIGFLMAVALGANLIDAIISGLVGWIIIAAVEIFVGAAIFHLAGRYIFGKFKLGFGNTMVAVAYAYSALQWLILFAGIIGIVLLEVTALGPIYSIFEFVALLWGLVVLVSALSHMQKTRALYALGSVILIPLMIIILYIFLAALSQSPGSLSTSGNVFTEKLTT